jgi:L-methionine (R)-S-oxide reductase
LNEKSKIQKYERLFDQLQELLKKSCDVLSQYATINAILYHKVDYFSWVGFYLLSNNKLIVGPYQGPVACQVLEYHRGVCWHSVLTCSIIVVPDVSRFEGHIACDTRSKSEIVFPIFNSNKQVIAVLDLDSTQLNAFDEIDKEGIAKIVNLIKC